MTDIPILFSEPMVQALLAGRKTMTRRLAWGKYKEFPEINQRLRRRSPWTKIKPGDRLWVREAWQLHSRATDFGCVVYRASINGSWTEAHEMVPVAKLMGKRLQPKPFQMGWRAPLHLFRDLSRITLVVTGIKTECLQDIIEADACAEGAIGRTGNGHTFGDSSARNGFADIWRKLHGEDSWKENPEVVAISFRVIRANIDAPAALAA